MLATGGARANGKGPLGAQYDSEAVPQRCALDRPHKRAALTGVRFTKRCIMTNNDNDIDEVELARLGIRRMERHVFQVGEYIYSNLRDAIAAAERAQKS